MAEAPRGGRDCQAGYMGVPGEVVWVLFCVGGRAGVVGCAWGGVGRGFEFAEDLLRVRFLSVVSRGAREEVTDCILLSSHGGLQ